MTTRRVFELGIECYGDARHFNIPNNAGETGHLFEKPTSNETACQQRVMHTFPSVFHNSGENRTVQGSN